MNQQATLIPHDNQAKLDKLRALINEWADKRNIGDLRRMVLLELAQVAVTAPAQADRRAALAAILAEQQRVRAAEPTAGRPSQSQSQGAEWRKAAQPPTN